MDSSGDSDPPRWADSVFGQDCDLTSLPRYRFRNLIQGRLTYDDLSVINGKTIALREPDKRTCTADFGLSMTTVTARGRAANRVRGNTRSRPPRRRTALGGRPT